MKGLGAAAASAAVIILSGAGVAFAADLNTKAPVLKAAPADATCTSIMDFFTTACQVAAYGVRFYGTVDIGYGYQTNGSPWDKNFGPSTGYLVSKAGSHSLWELSPNAMSQSNIGVQIKEPLGLGWSFVGQYEVAFDPYSLNLNGGVNSLHNNIGVALPNQTANGDSSGAGQFYNSLGFFGFSNDTYGTLTFFRQNSLMLDGVRSYDPLGGSYGFSVIGFQGTTAGGGSTEDARVTTSAKYRVNIGNFRLGALWQFGGYDLGNASDGAFQGQFGGDFKIGPGVLSLDAIGGYTRDAVSLGLGPKNSDLNSLLTAPSFLTATLSNNTNVMALAKYTVDKLTLSAGYEWIQFANPSDARTSFTDMSGGLICSGCNVPGTAIFNGTNINSTAFKAHDKILQVVWAGGKYAVTDSLDVAAAYYHYNQNNYAASTVSCAGNLQYATGASACAGTLDAVSAMIDWRFAPKWDTYIGTMYSQLNGGMDNGYLARNNWATTGGIRFRW